MKKKIYYLILLSLIIIPFTNVKALSANIKVGCNKKEYKINEKATCKVIGTSNEEIYSVSAKIKDFKSNKVIINFKTDKVWQGTGEDGNIQLYSDKGKKGTFNIGTLTIKPKNKISKLEKISVNIDDIAYGSVSGKEYNVDKVQNTIYFGTNVKKDIMILGIILILSSVIVIGLKKSKKKNK